MCSRIVLLAALLVSASAAAQIAVTDVSGHSIQLFDAASSKPVVLVFVRTDCPISNRYAPEVERLFRAYADRVAFYLVYPDEAESADSIQKHLAEYRYTAQALRDPGHDLVRLAKARVTPEAAVFSARGQLLYHGRIDNRQVSLGKAMVNATRHDLRQALEAVLAGRAVKEASAPAIGCSLADIK